MGTETFYQASFWSYKYSYRQLSRQIAAGYCSYVPSLELRRLLADLLWCYKSLLGIVDMQSGVFLNLICSVQPGVINTNCTKNTCFRHKSNIFQRACCKCVNSLTEDVDFSPLSTCRFCRSILRFNFSGFYETFLHVLDVRCFAMA